MNFVFESVENIMGKGGNTGNIRTTTKKTLLSNTQDCLAQGWVITRQQNRRRVRINSLPQNPDF